MPLYIDGDRWRVNAGCPFSFGLLTNEGDIPWAVYILYLDDHVEVTYLPAQRIHQIMNERTFFTEGYYHPLGGCREEPGRSSECIVFCRSGIESGGYPFPV